MTWPQLRRIRHPFFIAAGGVACLLFLSIPVRWFYDAWQSPQGLEKTIHFSQIQEEHDLPEVRRLHPPRNSIHGYDAQFYAQIAFDPTLRHPGFIEALDNPTYRARRILMPALVYLATWNLDPALKLQCFAWINPLCWIALLLLIARITRLQNWHDATCLLACALGSGTLFSFARSLTDLPSAVLGLSALVAAGSTGTFFFALSLLCRDTACASLPAAWQGSFTPQGPWKASLLRIGLILLPFLLWCLYVTICFETPLSSGDPRNFAAPLTGLVDRFIRDGNKLIDNPHYIAFFRTLAPLSLAAQALYLALTWKKNHSNPFWRMGIGFAFLLLIIGPAVWAESRTACRVLLPLTLAFNLIIRRENHPAFLTWFIAGNIGLLEQCLRFNQSIGGFLPGLR